MRCRTLALLVVSCATLGAVPIAFATPVIGDGPGYDASLDTQNLVLDVHANTPLGPVSAPVAVPIVTSGRAILAAGPASIGTPSSGVDITRAVGDRTLGTNGFNGVVPLLPDDALSLRTGFGSFDAVAATGLGAVPVWTDSRDAILAALANTRGDATDSLGADQTRTIDGTLPHDADARPGDASLVYHATSSTGTTTATSTRSPAPLTTTSVPTPSDPTASGLTTATVALVAGALALPALLGWALYHRIRGHSTLENDTRKTVYDTVCARPGIGVQELAAMTKISYSTTSYHLDRLVDAHMIVVSQDGNKLRYYKNGGSFSEAERKVLPVLKNAEALRVLEAIVASPGTYRAALAERLGVTPTTINWHLKRLAEAGLTEEVRQGRNAFLRAPPERIAMAFAPLVPKLDESEAELAASARRLLAASGQPVAPFAPPVTPLAA